MCSFSSPRAQVSLPQWYQWHLRILLCYRQWSSAAFTQVCVCKCFTPLCDFQLMPEFTSGFLCLAQGSLSTMCASLTLYSFSSAAAVLFSEGCKGKLFTKAGTAASQEPSDYFVLFYSEPSSKNSWLCTSFNQSVDLLHKPASIAPLLNHHCSGVLSISWECSCKLRFSPHGLSLKIWLLACWHLLWEFSWICACF